jgi:PmbA protein
VKSPFVEEVLNAATKVAEAAEVFELSTQGKTVNFEANNLKQLQSNESYSLALRIFRAGRIGFALVNGNSSLPPQQEKSQKMMGILLNMAIETARFGSLSNFDFSPKSNYPKVNVFDPRIERISAEEILRLGYHPINKVKQFDPDILCDVEVNTGIKSVHIINSQGGEASYKKSIFGISIEGILTRDTDMLFVGDSEGSCQAFKETADIANRVVAQLEMAKKQATVSTKSLPVIFTPRGVASVFFSPIALAFNGKTVLEGASPLKDKLGKMVFNETLSLWDDPTIDYCLASSPCDDEGVPSQCTMLIQEGITMNFIYDLQTATLAKTRSTGNGKRNGSGTPKPGMKFLVMKEGNTCFHDMVANIKEGLIVEQLMGAGQGNMLGGDFGGNVLLGYKVENGEIIGRVKDTMISGNIYEVLKQPIEIGCVAREVDGIMKTPHLYCPYLAVSTKGR